MTECRKVSEIEIKLDPAATRRTVTDAIEPFVTATRADEMLSILLGQMARSDNHQAGSADVRAMLSHHTRRASTGLKLVELPAAGANPMRVRRWLETSRPHVSVVYSPLKERGPPFS